MSHMESCPAVSSKVDEVDGLLNQIACELKKTADPEPALGILSEAEVLMAVVEEALSKESKRQAVAIANRPARRQEGIRLRVVLTSIKAIETETEYICVMDAGRILCRIYVF